MKTFDNRRLLFFEIKRVFEKESFMKKTKIRKTESGDVYES